MPCFVELRVVVTVDLPGGIPPEWKDGEDDSCPPETREKIIEAALSAVRAGQSVGVYLDGDPTEDPDTEATECYVECCDSDVEEVRAES